MLAMIAAAEGSTAISSEDACRFTLRQSRVSSPRFQHHLSILFETRTEQLDVHVDFEPFALLAANHIVGFIIAGKRFVLWVPLERLI